MSVRRRFLCDHESIIVAAVDELSERPGAPLAHESDFEGLQSRGSMNRTMT